MPKSTQPAGINCPLCHNTKDFSTLTGPDQETYFLCSSCYLVHAEKKDLPTADEEKERYLLHTNSIEDQGYVNFLYRAISPLLPHLQPNMHGLDFGCGPAPILAELVNREGFKCSYYDPIFFPKINMREKYDFIFATECFEHFFSPAAELQKISNLLKPGGFLAVMTELWQNTEQFSSWYYLRDNTHVSFYHQNTLNFIQAQYGYSEIFNNGKRVFIFRKL